MYMQTKRKIISNTVNHKMIDSMTLCNNNENVLHTLRFDIDKMANAVDLLL